MLMRVSETRSPPLRVLVAGGGVAGLETILALRELAVERVGIELLSPENDFVYRPLSVAEPFGVGAARSFDLARVATDRSVRHRRDALASVHLEDHSVTTRSGAMIEYDVLVVAVGAVPVEAIPGALTFRGSADSPAFGALLDDLREGRTHRVAFAVPGGVAWPLPLYELALMTAADLRERGIDDVELSFVTPEDSPLCLFGAKASDAVAALLEESGIRVIAARYPEIADDHIVLMPGDEPLPVQRIVAMPRFAGPAIPGLPHTTDGFLEVDVHGRVRGVRDVYAAGDGTSFPIKQGGLAAQQADAVAESIAARAGAQVDPTPFKPVLRGLLLTGRNPRYLRSSITGGQGETSVATDYALWWPPSKVAGRHLAPYLATVHGAFDEPSGVGERFEIELDL